MEKGVYVSLFFVSSQHLIDSTGKEFEVLKQVVRSLISDSCMGKKFGLEKRTHLMYLTCSLMKISKRQGKTSYQYHV